MGKKGFSFVEMTVAMVIVGVILVASLPFITLKKISLGSHKDAETCIITDNADTGTSACQQAIKDCKENIGNSCNTMLYLMDSYATPAKSILQASCDAGSARACDYFIQSCASASSSSDSKCTTDLRYFLNKDKTNTSSGKMYVYNKVKKWLTDHIGNIEDEVKAACTANTDSTACTMYSQKVYNFNRYESEDFDIADSITGTTFTNSGYSSGVVTLVGSDAAYSSYITTTDTNHIDDATSKVVDVTITQTSGSTSVVLYLVSFDGRATWKKINSVNCASTTTSDLSFSAYNTATEIQNYVKYCSLPNGTLDFAINLKTTDGTTLPSVDQIVIRYY